MSLDIDEIKQIDGKLDEIIRLTSSAKYHLSTRDDIDHCLDDLDEVKSRLCEIDEIVIK